MHDAGADGVTEPIDDEVRLNRWATDEVRSRSTQHHYTRLRRTPARRQCRKLARLIRIALPPGRALLVSDSAHRHGIVARGFDQGPFEQRYLVLREREQRILVAILQIDLLDHGGAAPAQWMGGART